MAKAAMGPFKARREADEEPKDELGSQGATGELRVLSPLLVYHMTWRCVTSSRGLARAIAFGFLEAPLKGKLLLPTADLGDSVPLLQDVKANKPENTAGNYKCRPRKFQMRLP